MLFYKVALQRSSSRGDQIKSSLLDENLVEKMIVKLQNKTGIINLYKCLIFSLKSTIGNSTSCVQLFLCKMIPILTSAQSATNTTFNTLFGHSLQESRYNQK